MTLVPFILPTPAKPVSKGKLYVVATPIGNRQDWSPRAIDTLKSCSRVLCEDTRHSLPLLTTFGINVPLVSLHQHNERARSEEVMRWLSLGETIGLISDAGTPAVSDPGAYVVNTAINAGFTVSPIPGACAFIAAWSVSGFASLPQDPAKAGFTFIGFIPTEKKSRRLVFADMAQSARPMILYEAPHRLRETLAGLADYFPTDHPIFYGREISKIHETFSALSLADLREQIERQEIPTLGEWVIIIQPLPLMTEISAIPATEVARRLRKNLQGLMSPSSLARLMHQVTGLPRQAIYQQLLEGE